MQAAIREQFVAHKRLEKSAVQLTNELHALEVMSNVKAIK